MTELQPPPPRTLGPLTRTDFVRYQGASGDMNPVHHDEGFATAAGFPAPLAVGMYTAGALNAWATDWLGPRQVRRTRTRWHLPCFPGDVLTLNGTVEREYDEGDEARVDLVLTATRGDDVVLTVWMTFVRL